MKDVAHILSLQELSEIESLSVRSQNICGGNDLTDILSILQYYRENNNFLTLRNCGQISNTELIELCEKYKDFDIAPQKKFEKNDTDNSIFQHLTPKEIENPIYLKINSLTARQKKILNNIIESQASELTVRSLNGLNQYLNSNLNIKGLEPFLINENFDIKNLRHINHIGAISENEISLFFSNIKRQIEIISLFGNENELKIEFFNSFLTQRFCLKPFILKEIWRDYDINNGLPIFKTCKVLIEHEILFDQRDKVVFENGLNFTNSSNIHTLEEIGTTLKITRERTRQIRNSISDNFYSIFSFIKGLEFDALNLYGIDVNSNLIVISKEIISEINRKESNAFNSHFIIKILSILFENTHILIGNEETILYKKNIRSSHNWHNTYLIKSEITKIFSFDDFINEVGRRLGERIEEDYSFHFETYLLKFKKNQSPFVSQEITQISEHILFNEFQISLDSDDNIIFKRNTFKQVGDYVYDILNERKTPLTVYEIYKQLTQISPDITKSAEALRGSCQRDPNLIYFGRSSTYGLKKWEDADIVKGGTMHDISEEYLEQFNSPKHIDEILKYVSNYREDITSRNLLYNLKSAENRRFLFFKDNYIGLVSKSYGNEFSRLSKVNIERKTWEENFSLLENFINEFERLPYSTQNDKEERLYRFMNKQIRKAKSNNLDEQKTNLLTTLITPYLNSNKPQRNKKTDFIQRERPAVQKQKSITSSSRAKFIPIAWWNSYHELKKYLQENNSYPKASENRHLYSFCYSCNKKLESGTLHESQVEALQEINFNFSSEKKVSWDDFFNELKSFITEYNRWPKSSDHIADNEMRLYRFCNTIFKSLSNEELSEGQIDKLESIKFPFEKHTLTDKWLDNYNKLKEFREMHPTRWPQARGFESEKALYQFCYRTRKGLLNGSLEDYKVQLLNELNFEYNEKYFNN
jgi:hypothetical protein